MRVTPEQLEHAFESWLLEWQRTPAARAAAALIDLKTVDPKAFASVVTPFFIELLQRQGVE